MYRCSNTVIGFLNLLTLLSSIPIIGGGLWMAKSKTSCESFLQTPLLIIGFVILILSLAGFIGSCFHVAWVLWLYLAVMFLLITALMALTVFGFIVTNRGDGVEVPGRVYKEYHLENYSPWLRKRLKDPRYWETIRTCILGSKTCAKIAYWTPFDYLQRDMSPIQMIFFIFLPQGYSVQLLQATDCMQLRGGRNDSGPRPGLLPRTWNNHPNLLCYECDSCKAGVLETMRIDWRKLSILNIVMVILLICIYSVGCCAYQNTKRAQTDNPYGQNRMSKVRPRWDFYRWRWLDDRRHQLY